MKCFKLLFCAIILLVSFSAQGQVSDTYEANSQYAYGRPNPKAPKQIKDYAPLIGICDCTSQNRNPDQTWADPVPMTWVFKYIMNGMAVQDETLKADGAHSGSIRQYNSDSTKWYVHYYSSAAPIPTLPSWEGVKDSEANKIVLYKDSPAPNGTPGNYRLTFSDISEEGFKWVGEWVDKAETMAFPTWKIDCKKRNTP